MAKERDKERTTPDPFVRNLQRYYVFNRKLSKATKYIILDADPVAKRREVLLHLIRVVEVRQTLHLSSYPSQQDAYSGEAEMSSAAQLCRGALPDDWDHNRLSG